MSGTAASLPELTAICHLLKMDTGLFCISLAEPPQPGLANPHLPGVRLSLPPGPETEHRNVTISTFRADGWLDMDRPAALVHVLRGPVHVLLTIYHEATQPREAAPKLVINQLAQVMTGGRGAPAPAAPGTLQPGFGGATFGSGHTAPPQPVFGQAPAPQPGSAQPAYAQGGHGQGGHSQGAYAPPGFAAAPGDVPFVPMAPTPPQVVTGFSPGAAAPSPAAQAPGGMVFGGGETGAAPGPAPATPLAEAQIVAHIRNRGDVRARFTDWIGLPGSRLWVEGFGISVPAGWSPDDIEYQGVLAKTGATPWMSGPEFCGSRGLTVPLLGFALRLKGTAARLYDCSYRASFIDGTTAGPVQQGQLCQSVSLAGLEAMQFSLVPRR